jgi:putative oxidoreductase
MSTKRNTEAGVLLLTGFLTRLAAIPLVMNMVVSITATKNPILQKSGFGAISHEARGVA